MQEYTDCPNCGTRLKKGLMSSVELLDAGSVKLINEYSDKKSDHYCNKCGKTLLEEADFKLRTEKIAITNEMEGILDAIPVISIHTPFDWDYKIIRMVTGQSTTGTGVIAEFSSSFTDLFGKQSGRYNKKLKSGENLCFAQLRKQALDLGGNAVIATDIDYSEVGGEKGMLMVCMGGTAVILNNPIVLGEERATQIAQLAVLNKRLQFLNSFEETNSL